MTIAPGSGGKPVTGHLVAVDYCATCDDAVPAMTVKSGTGKYVGSLSVNTRQLSNGRHYLIYAFILRLWYWLNFERSDGDSLHGC